MDEALISFTVRYLTYIHRIRLWLLTKTA